MANRILVIVDRIIIWGTRNGHITSFNTSKPNWRDDIRLPGKNIRLSNGRPVITQGDYLDYIIEVEHTTVDFIKEIDPTNKDDITFAKKYGIHIF